MSAIFQSRSEIETIRIARDLAAGLPPGSVVQLYGELGAGKTAFVRGLVEAVGGCAQDVTSPTFALVQDYGGRMPVHHIDLYRVSPAEVDDLGLDELSIGSLVAIEWADRLPRDMADAVRVYIEDRGGDERRIRIERATRSGSSGLPS